MKKRAPASGRQLPAALSPPSGMRRPAGNNDYVLDPLLQSPLTSSSNSISSTGNIRGLSAVISSPKPKSKKRASASPRPRPLSATGGQGHNVAASCSSSVYCPDCGKCRCEVCTSPRSLPHTSLCQDRVTCSPDAVVDACTCMTAARYVLYHGLGGGRDPDNGDDVTDVDDAAGQPCACRSQPFCCERWTCLVGASLLCPCLCLYWPLHGCLRLIQRLHDRSSRPGCRCKLPASPTSSTGEQSDLTATSLPSSYSRPQSPLVNRNHVITAYPLAEFDIDDVLRNRDQQQLSTPAVQPPPVAPRRTLSQRQGQATESERGHVTHVSAGERIASNTSCRRRVPSPPRNLPSTLSSVGGEQCSATNDYEFVYEDGTLTLPLPALPRVHLHHTRSVPGTPSSQRVVSVTSADVCQVSNPDSGIGGIEPPRPPPPLPRKQNKRALLVHALSSNASAAATVSRDMSSFSSNADSSVPDNRHVTVTLTSSQQPPALPPKLKVIRGASLP